MITKMEHKFYNLLKELCNEGDERKIVKYLTHFDKYANCYFRNSLGKKTIKMLFNLRVKHIKLSTQRLNLFNEEETLLFNNGEYSSIETDHEILKLMLLCLSKGYDEVCEYEPKTLDLSDAPKSLELFDYLKASNDKIGLKRFCGDYLAENKGHKVKSLITGRSVKPTTELGHFLLMTGLYN